MKKILIKENFHILLISLLLFSSFIYFGIANVIIYALSFLILVEIIRTIYDFVFKDNNRIKLRYIIDGGILFGMRELFVGWVMLKTDLFTALAIMITSIITIGILLYYRIKVIKYSPDNLESCKNCKLKENYYE